jgi:hypothetical protein
VNSGLGQATASDNQPRAKKFYNLSQVVMTAQDQLKQNVNAKLLLTNLFLGM